MDINYHFGNLKQIYHIDALQSEIDEIDHKMEAIDMSDVYEIEEKTMMSIVNYVMQTMGFVKILKKREAFWQKLKN